MKFIMALQRDNNSPSNQQSHIPRFSPRKITLLGFLLISYNLQQGLCVSTHDPVKGSAIGTARDTYVKNTDIISKPAKTDPYSTTDNYNEKPQFGERKPAYFNGKIPWKYFHNNLKMKREQQTNKDSLITNTAFIHRNNAGEILRKRRQNRREEQIQEQKTIDKGIQRVGPVKSNINITVETTSYKIELPSAAAAEAVYSPTAPPISKYSAGMCQPDTSTPMNLTVNVASAAASAGPTGAPGLPGLPGTKGKPGERGPVGLVGPQGHQGSKGNSGKKGVPGKTGNRGAKGEKGEKGETGMSGQPQSRAAVSAILTEHFGPIQDAIVPFNLVLTDLGDNYDNETGVFICTMPGVYVMSVYLMSHPGSKINGRIYINDRPVAAVWADDNKKAGFYPSASIQAISRLEFGDQVFVKLVSGYGESWVHANYNIFSVFLLYEDMFF